MDFYLRLSNLIFSNTLTSLLTALRQTHRVQAPFLSMSYFPLKMYFAIMPGALIHLPPLQSLCVLFMTTV
jgi:hypothetical protein